MIRTISIIFAVVALLHGLVHLLGFLAYWPLAKFNELPYKTALLNGRWEVGEAGMRLFSLAWLLAGLAFVVAAVALLSGLRWWAPVMAAAVLLSMTVCILDWSAAFRGFWIDLVYLLALVVVFGFRLPPSPFVEYTLPAGAVQTVPLPQGLPAPVERFYRLTYGDQIPVYHTAVITGRGTLRFMGVTMPARLRFTHLTGQGYRHYMETTFYGFPIFKVDEHYLDNAAWMRLPFGVVENDPYTNSAANQGLWAEMMYYPASFLTDSRVRWEAVDGATANLHVPYGEGEQVFVVKFDPQSGAFTSMDTLRYRDSTSGKLLHWTCAIVDGKNIFGKPAQLFTATWEDEGTPWLIAELEDISFNSDVSEYIRQMGQ